MEAPLQSLLIRNVRAVLTDRLAEDVDILIENGVIAQIVDSGDRAEGRKDWEEVDLGSATLYPGFIDAHIHGAIGIDTMAADADDLVHVAEFLAGQGVTGWLPTLVPAAHEDYEKAVRAIEQAMKDPDRNPGARVLGVHYEGPFVNTAQCGALRSGYFRTFSGPSDIDELPVPHSAGAVRMMTLAPEVVGGIELVRELNARGWIVSIGHTRAGIELLDRAFAAGAHHITHFMNAMPQLHHRTLGPVGWALSREDVTCDVIADGVHIDPSVLRLLLRVLGSDRLTLISDAIAAAGKGDGAYEIWGETITVKGGQTQNARGSIAGSVITMLDAVRTMLSLGATEVAVALMAATNPSRLLGFDHDCGSIEAGKRADLVALDQAGQVRATIVGGRLVVRSDRA